MAAINAETVAPANEDEPITFPTVSEGGQHNLGRTRVFKTPVGNAAPAVVINSDGCDEEVEEPSEGMIFCSWQELEVYYKEYGKNKGFGIVRAGCKTGKDRNERTSMTWRCEYSGDPERRMNTFLKHGSRKRGDEGSKKTDFQKMFL